MKFQRLHSWDLTPREAILLQNKLRNKVVLKDCLKKIRTIAGADIAFSKDDNTGFAGIIVYKFPELTEIERASATDRLKFPYIPGLLSFREAPLLLEAFKKLESRPDVILCDGQGIAHPRRIGIASHMGLWLQTPSIGCAKSRLIGTYNEPPSEKGASSILYDGKDIIGSVLRTRTNVKPIFVSPGHLISLKSATEIVLECTDGYRIPKPTREADQFVAQQKIG